MESLNDLYDFDDFSIKETNRIECNGSIQQGYQKKQANSITGWDAVNNDILSVNNSNFNNNTLKGNIIGQLNTTTNNVLLDNKPTDFYTTKFHQYIQKTNRNYDHSWNNQKGNTPNITAKKYDFLNSNNKNHLKKVGGNNYCIKKPLGQVSSIKHLKNNDSIIISSNSQNQNLQILEKFRKLRNYRTNHHKIQPASTNQSEIKDLQKLNCSINPNKPILKTSQSSAQLQQPLVLKKNSNQKEYLDFSDTKDRLAYKAKPQTGANWNSNNFLSQRAESDDTNV